MLGWGYRFCEKRMLIKREMTTKEADKFMAEFDNVYKSGLTEEAKKFQAMYRKFRWIISHEMGKLLDVYEKFFKDKMKVFFLI